MTKASKLAAFLLALQTSRSVQKRFYRNKKQEMLRFDLEDATIKAVIAGDTDTLWNILTRPPGHVGVVTGAARRRRRKPMVPPTHVATTVGVAKGSRRQRPKRA